MFSYTNILIPSVWDIHSNLIFEIQSRLCSFYNVLFLAKIKKLYFYGLYNDSGFSSFKFPYRI